MGRSSYIRKLQHLTEDIDAKASSSSTFVLSHFSSVYHTLHSATLFVIVFRFKLSSSWLTRVWLWLWSTLYLGKQTSIVTSKHRRRRRIWFKETMSNTSLDPFGLSYLDSALLPDYSASLSKNSTSAPEHSALLHLATLGIQAISSELSMVGILRTLDNWLLDKLNIQATHSGSAALGTRCDPLGLEQHSTLGRLGLAHPT